MPEPASRPDPTSTPPPAPSARPDGGRRRRPPPGRLGGRDASTPTRWSPTTWPTPRPRWRRPGPCSTTAARGAIEAAIACAFVADAVWDVAVRLLGREADWGVGPGRPASRPSAFVGRLARPGLPGRPGRRGRVPATSTPTSSWSQDTFRRFAEERIRPVAEHIHRTNSDIPEEIIAGLAEIGAFGLSIPEEYGGFATGGESEYLGMVVATEELSRGSLGVGGSLITRPEILTRALVRGGTEEQKRHWLPKLASGEIMDAVAVTEPDFGSDVAGLKVTRHARPTAAGRSTASRPGARSRPGPTSSCCWPAPTPTGPGPPRPVACSSSPSRGATATASRSTRRARGRGPADGGPADRHPRLPGHALLRGGVRRLVGARRQPHRRRRRPRPGLLLQMEGFENGRLQTAARAVGRHAGGLRGGPRLRRRAPGVRPPGRRLPADPGQAGPHGRASSRRPASSPTTWPG